MLLLGFFANLPGGTDVVAAGAGSSKRTSRPGPLPPTGCATISTMTGERTLFETARDALELVDPIEFACAEEPGGVDRLVYVCGGSEPGWGLVPVECLPGGDAEVALEAVDPAWADDWLPVSEQLASVLVERRMEAWLLERGWQVQVSVRKTGARQWRLADCLAFADGGGDRLEADYPLGSDRLDVLVASVLAVARFTFTRSGPR